RTVDAKQINFVLVDRRRMSAVPVGPARRKLYIDFPELIYGSVLHLNSPEFAILVSHQIERSVLRQWKTDCESLAIQVDLSLQNPQVTLALCMMRHLHILQ